MQTNKDNTQYPSSDEFDELMKTNFVVASVTYKMLLLNYRALLEEQKNCGCKTAKVVKPKNLAKNSNDVKIVAKKPVSKADFKPSAIIHFLPGKLMIVGLEYTGKDQTFILEFSLGDILKKLFLSSSQGACHIVTEGKECFSIITAFKSQLTISAKEEGITEISFSVSTFLHNPKKLFGINGKKTAKEISYYDKTFCTAIICLVELFAKDVLALPEQITYGEKKQHKKILSLFDDNVVPEVDVGENTPCIEKVTAVPVPNKDKKPRRPRINAKPAKPVNEEVLATESIIDEHQTVVATAPSDNAPDDDTPWANYPEDTP